MMTAEMSSKLKKLLVKHEGCETFPYVDTVGKITIGIGYNLSDRGMSQEWINQQYEKDVNYFYDMLMKDYDWFKDLNEARQMVLVDMCFMGYKKFSSFKKMIAALASHDYMKAADEMLDSKWATQVHGRANELADIMVSGQID
jgi:lysozyme